MPKTKPIRPGTILRTVHGTAKVLGLDGDLIAVEIKRGGWRDKSGQRHRRLYVAQHEVLGVKGQERPSEKWRPPVKTVTPTPTPSSEPTKVVRRVRKTPPFAFQVTPEGKMAWSRADWWVVWFRGSRYLYEFSKRWSVDMAGERAQESARLIGPLIRVRYTDDTGTHARDQFDNFWPPVEVPDYVPGSIPARAFLAIGLRQTDHSRKQDAAVIKTAATLSRKARRLVVHTKPTTKPRLKRERVRRNGPLQQVLVAPGTVHLNGGSYPLVKFERF